TGRAAKEPQLVHGDLNAEATRLMNGDSAARGKTRAHKNAEVAAAHQTAELDRDARDSPNPAWRHRCRSWLCCQSSGLRSKTSQIGVCARRFVSSVSLQDSVLRGGGVGTARKQFCRSTMSRLSQQRRCVQALASVAWTSPMKSSCWRQRLALIAQ